MRRRWLIIVLIAVIVITALAVGFHFYKINVLKSALRPLALEDELLFKGMLAVTKILPNFLKKRKRISRPEIRSFQKSEP